MTERDKDMAKGKKKNPTDKPEEQPEAGGDAAEPRSPGDSPWIRPEGVTGDAVGEADDGMAAPPGDDEVAEEEAEPEPEPEPEPEDPVARLEAEAADLKDRLLRALAEAENVRRRAERDKGDIAKYAISGFARSLLTVADNLRRALDSVPEEARQENEALENLALGIEMTERELLGALEAAGVGPIDAMDQKFDHNLHEAMFELEDESKPAGTVVQVLETGYVIQDRLLRPAKVAVSKGGPKEAPGEPAAEPSEAGSESGAQTDPAAKDSSLAYEKQTDAQGETAGSQLDEKL